MDKTAVCCIMIGNTSFNVTGEKDIPLQLTGNRKKWFSVCLTVKSDWTKYAGRETAALNENPHRRPGSIWKQLKK